VLASLQIAAIVVVGVATVARFHVFAAVDEENHFAYVQEVAEHGRLPWLGRDVVSWQVQAIEDEVYPRHSSRDPRRLGYGGLSSEALQPPLYYLLAVPAFSIPSSYRAKVFAVRAFDLLLLLVGVALLAMLARAVLGARWLTGFCLALSVLMWPGIVVRAITVSNAALEIPMVLLYLLTLWHATARRRPGLLVACGAIAGLCVLTQLTLVCLVPLLIVPAWAFLRARRGARAWGTILATLVVPALLVAPWLVSNESRYGALTASTLAKREQQAYLGPPGSEHGLSLVFSLAWRLPRAPVPQEWWPEYSNSGLAIVLRVLPAVLVAMALVALIARPRLLWSRASALLASPLVLGLGALVGIVVVADWPSSFLPRFLNPMLAPFALFAAWAWITEDRRRSWVLGAAAVLTVAAAFVWVYNGGAYYFTNVGAQLGIHAPAQA
jgi:4-amino-4-deoxy-L-arabinose transferase-like glycosyltransferase